jgi:nucleotide-binding universal stress UspA family protein
MYARILIASDGSELADRAVEHGLQLAKLAGSEVTVVTVTEPVTIVGGGYASIAGGVIDPLPELIEAQEKAARELLERAKKKAAEQGVTAKTILVDNSFAAEGIVATADKIGAELIIMGSHGRRGLNRLLLGSQTNNVLAHTKIPVLVTR